MNYILHNSLGEIKSLVDCQPEVIHYLEVNGVVAIEGVADLKLDYIEDGQVMQKPAKPTEHHVFNYTTKQWDDPRTLQDFKDAKWAAIKQARTEAEHGGFTWDGSVFDSDAVSQGRITGAVTLAQMSSAFEINWILADNTVRTLGQMDMLQVGGALGTHVATQFSIGVYLRGLIEASTTPAEVEAISWPTT